MLISLLKQGVNTSLYRQIYRELADAANSVEAFDTNWCTSTDRASATRMDILEQELNAAKSMLSKEGIRNAHSNIGDFHYERGNLEEALKSFCRCRDYCTMQWHVEEMYERTFNVSADMDQFIMVGSVGHVKSPAEDAPNRPFSAERKQLTSALVALRQKDYAGAARSILDVKKFGESFFPSLMSAVDISVYGTVLAMAALSRDDLKGCANAGHPFRAYIERVPQMEMFLSDFLDCRYNNVMNTCSFLSTEFELDVILKGHLDTLLSLIMDKVFLQYVEPYEAIDLRRMASSMNKPIDEIIDRLAKLINSGSIQARIDTVSKTLRRFRRNNQNWALQKVLKVSDEHAINSQRAIIRMCMLQNGVFDEENPDNDISTLG